LDLRTLALHRKKLGLGLFLLAAITMVCLSYSALSYIAAQKEALPYTVLDQVAQTYPNPGHTNVTLIGSMTGLTINPTCGYLNPPCAIAAAPLYYIEVYGTNDKIRLIFPNATVIPVNGAHLIVTGMYVTPSTYKPNQWSPAMTFQGDLYVRSYSYTFLPFI